MRLEQVELDLCSVLKVFIQEPFVAHFFNLTDSVPVESAHKVAVDLFRNRWNLFKSWKAPFDRFEIDKTSRVIEVNSEFYVISDADWNDRLDHRNSLSKIILRYSLDQYFTFMSSL